MTNNNFEKQIKDKLNRFEVEPSSNLLENIMEQRAVKYKAVLRLSYLKLGVAMLGLLVVSIVVWLNRSSSDSLPVQGDAGKTSAIVKDDTSSSGRSGQVSGSEDAGLSQQEVTGRTSKLNSTKGIGKERQSDIVDATSGNNKDAVVNKRRSSGQTTAGTSRKDSRTLALGHESNNRRSKVKTISSNSDYSDNGENITERYFNVDAQNRPLIAATYHKGQSHLMVYHSVDKDLLDQLDMNYLFLQPMHHYTISNVNEDQPGLLDCQRFAGHKVSRRPVFIDLMVTPLYTYQNVKGNANYNSMAGMSINKQYAGRVTVPVSDRFSVFSGLAYTELYAGYKGGFEHQSDAVRYEQVTTYINDPVLGTIPVTHTDTINYVKKDQLQYNFRNAYKIFSVPVGVSYNFGVSKFDFAVHGSALLNVLTSAQGTNVDFVSDQGKAFQSGSKQLGVGAGLSFMAAYKLNNRFKLIVEPGVQYYKINGSKIGNVVNERILNSGLSIGLRYTLF